jgi:hypothetical protein
MIAVRPFQCVSALVAVAALITLGEKHRCGAPLSSAAVRPHRCPRLDAEFLGPRLEAVHVVPN